MKNLRDMGLDLLCSLEDQIILKEESEVLELLGLEENLPKTEVSRLLRTIINEKIATSHITPEMITKVLSSQADVHETSSLYIHISRCSCCSLSLERKYLPPLAEVFNKAIDREFRKIVGLEEKNQVPEDKPIIEATPIQKEVRNLGFGKEKIIVPITLEASIVETTVEKQPAKEPTKEIEIEIPSLAKEAVAQQEIYKEVAKVKTLKDILSKLQSYRLEFQKIDFSQKILDLFLLKREPSSSWRKALIPVASGVFVGAVITGSALLLWNRPVSENPYELTQDSYTVAALSGENKVEVAKVYEAMSARLKKNSADINALLYRADAAEKLFLLERSIEDYKAYLNVSIDAENRARVEKQIAYLQAKLSADAEAELTRYELFQNRLNEYLQALVDGKRKVAQEKLRKAQSIADTIQDETKDKFAVDTIEYYANIPTAQAAELLQARLAIEEVAKVVSIDLYQDSIDKLERAKAVFTQYNATSDIQNAVVLLAKFLPKVGRVADARTELDQWLDASKEQGYLFNHAQLLYWDAQTNVYERREQEGLRKCQETVELCRSIGANKFLLYPLMLSAFLHIAGDGNDPAFLESLDGIAGSLDYNNPAFASQFYQAAGLSATGLSNPSLAEAYLQKAVQVSEEHQLHGYTVVAKSILASILAVQGEKAKSISLIQEARYKDLVKNVDPSAKKFQLIHILKYEGKVYGLAKDFARSEAAYREVMEVAREIGYKDFLSIGQWRKGLGEALVGQGKMEEGLKELLLAKEEVKKVRAGLHPKSSNHYLDLSFSGKDIDELIKIAQQSASK
ncbi:MAG: hypothetical protein JNN15_00875 [Blastocatellia bacterium]|nr:hypothetical protein [Blastocatellia bacterium]